MNSTSWYEPKPTNQLVWYTRLQYIVKLKYASDPLLYEHEHSGAKICRSSLPWVHSASSTQLHHSYRKASWAFVLLVVRHFLHSNLFPSSETLTSFWIPFIKHLRWNMEGNRTHCPLSSPGSPPFPSPLSTLFHSITPSMQSREIIICPTLTPRCVLKCFSASKNTIKNRSPFFVKWEL